MKHATMDDIAVKSGVTKATVSMVINNDRRISEKTRHRVLEIARELNYHPNELARKLARGKTENIAFLTPRFFSPFISAILEGFEKRALQIQKYPNGIQPYATWNQIQLLEELLRKVLYGRTVDAAVVLTQKPSLQVAREYHDRKIPLILIENELPHAYSIQVDNLKGGYLAGEYLALKGRKKIGVIMGETTTPAGLSPNLTAVDRLVGFQRALKDQGVPFDPQRIATITRYEFMEGRMAAGQLLRVSNDLDAIFCAAGDMVALGAMERLRELGKDIPKDVAVVGYDDLFAARLSYPPLTTIRQPFGEIAKKVFEMTDGRAKVKRVLLQPELLVRGSA